MYDIGSTLDKVKLAREGAAVRRCHATPVIGDHYNNGFHSFNMLCMLRILHPDPSKNLIWAVLEHDVPERLMGDIPATAKWFGIINAQTEEEVERHILNEIFDNVAMFNLTEEEHGWLKGLDMLEYYMYLRDQDKMGNRHVSVILDRVHRVFKGRASSFPEPINNLYWDTYGSTWDMMPDLGDN